MIRACLLQQCLSDIPAGVGWLGPDELATWRVLRFPKRRADWLLGRWTAKRTLAHWFSMEESKVPFRDVQVIAGSDGAPCVRFRGAPSPVSLSLSHTHGFALCALSSPGVAIGCDLEYVEDRSDSFISDYFTRGEQRQVASVGAGLRPAIATALWSAKESVLKLLRAGLRLDTRWVDVDLLAESGLWRPFRATFLGSIRFEGWWQIQDALVTTVVTEPPCPRPDVAREQMGAPE